MSYDVDIADDSFNYTWNLAPFFREFNAHPGDWHLRPAEDVAEDLRVALEAIAEEDIPSLREKFDPPNKWGSVPSAIQWLKEIHASCVAHPDAIVSVWT